MEIRTSRFVDGASSAVGLAVVFDVFRASNTVLGCFGAGAVGVVPVGGLGEAYRLKEENPNYLLVGEREGLPPEGFDVGNSPYLISKMDLSGKTVVFSSSAGSQGIVAAVNAEEVLIGSFANAGPLVSHILERDPDVVSLVAMGLNGNEKAIEDEECANFIREKLLGNDADFEGIRNRILEGNGAKRLRQLGQEKDLEISLQMDIYDIVPGYDRVSNRIVVL
ncbi:MAG: 2-phosphosulfolactate phosphatase [Candidatus Altiarchaeales archaeon]|nr:2-phosphosulfolactate phosphatase [Candidatus Altiarchaeales archaeon]MBD3417013.1 2-phosphosulfolactate phosphatase [Candidatus Altiarchaeales archaeon]